MEVKDWVLVSSAIIVVVGWFVNNYLNRRNEISKKRLEYRLETLHSIIPVFFSIQKSKGDPFAEDLDLLGNIESARSKFQLYGYKDEVEHFELFISSLEQGNIKLMLDNLQALILLVKNRIRKELDYD